MEHNERIDSSAGEPVLACKRRKHLRLAALAVCCALLGGIAGGAARRIALQAASERRLLRYWAGQQTAVSRGESTGAEPPPRRVWPRLRENLTPTQLYERYAPCVVGVLNPQRGHGPLWKGHHAGQHRLRRSPHGETARF